MTKPLPRWIMQRYSILWKSFGNNNFNHSDAFKALGKDNMVSIVFSELRQAGWLVMKMDAQDARKHVYSLKSPMKAVEEMGVSNGK